MKAILPALLFICALSVPAAVRAGDSDLPTTSVTPGRVISTDTQAICVRGYSQRVRDVTIDTKKDVFREYHVRYVRGRYEVDHLIPLSLGGANAIQNLWPQSRDAFWGANAKDHLEDTLHRMVCSGRLPLPQAQHEISANWIDAYKKYVGPTPDDTPLVKRESFHRRSRHEHMI